MEKQIKLFLEFLENDKKLSENTLQSYRRDIVQFQEYLDNERLSYSKVSQQEIKKYIEYFIIIWRSWIIIRTTKWYGLKRNKR